LVATLLWTLAAQAFKPPPINGQVMDTAGVLTPPQVARLNDKLLRVRMQTGFAVVVFIPSSLEGESMEDVAYTTFNTWKVGSAKGDDGVLLLIAPQERKARIETGKGVGGALTDLQSSRINREVVNPRLQEDQFYEAVNDGTSAIVRELVAGTPGGTSEPGKQPGAGQAPSPLRTGAYILGTLVVIILAIISPTFRQILFWMLLFGRGGGGGRGGFGGGNNYRGGGGSSGGGGSTDDW